MSIDEVKLWKAICQRLDKGNNTIKRNWDGRTWKEVIIKLNQVVAVERREQGGTWSDEEIFEGIVLGILSNQINWKEIDNIIDELPLLFKDYNIEYYAGLQKDDIKRDFLPWFDDRKIESYKVSDNLIYLVEAAKTLIKIQQESGRIEDFILQKFEENKDKEDKPDPKLLVSYFADNESPYKLKGLGMALAAEAFKNIGFNVAKPDRHINRAVGAFGLYNFENWNSIENYSTPNLNYRDDIKLIIMEIIENMAHEVGERTVFVDNAIWLLCAESGLHYTNSQLAQIMEDR